MCSVIKLSIVYVLLFIAQVQSAPIANLAKIPIGNGELQKNLNADQTSGCEKKTEETEGSFLRSNNEEGNRRNPGNPNRKCERTVVAGKIAGLNKPCKGPKDRQCGEGLVCVKYRDNPTEKKSFVTHICRNSTSPVDKKPPSGTGSKGNSNYPKTPSGTGSEGNSNYPKTPSGTGSKGDSNPPKTPSGTGSKGDSNPPKTPSGTGSKGDSNPPKTPSGTGSEGNTSGTGSKGNCKIAVLADKSFAESHGNNAEQAIKDIVKGTSDVMIGAFGFSISIESIDIENGLSPRGAKAAVSDYFKKRSETVTNRENLCFVVGFTSRKLEGALGWSPVGAACKGSTMVVGNDASNPEHIKVGIRVFTHELGHMLGSQHDEKTSCGESYWIMNTSARRHNEAIEFSQCSKDVINSNLGKYQCLRN